MIDVLLNRPVWLTWALLVLATIASTWFLSGDAIDPRWAVISIFAVAAWKVRLVLTDFIELRDAPLAGRLVFEGWALALPAALIVLVWPR